MDHTKSDTPPWVTDRQTKDVLPVPDGATMFDPPHPGEMVVEFLDDLSLSIPTAADALGVSSDALSEIVRGERAVTPDMAARLERLFGLSQEMWLKMQATHDARH